MPAAEKQGSNYGPGAWSGGPTLIVNGKFDKVTPKSSAKKLLKGIKNSRLIFIDGGHFAFAQNARVFNAIVKEFLLG